MSDLVGCIVTDPEFEKIAENIQRLGIAGVAVEELKKQFENLWAFWGQMQIRDK